MLHDGNVDGDQVGANPAFIRQRLHRWAHRHGRVFVWRTWTDDYRLLVTEVLLKQTRAEDVAQIVDELFGRFPDPASLAKADEQLEGLIRHLGLVRQRARQLRDLAEALESGAPTVTNDELGRLPGIGPYSAGMVAAMHGDPLAVAVDTNVARVVCRLFDLTPTHFEARKSTNVWRVTQVLVGRHRRVRTIWAVLDLAAAVCTAHKPLCTVCPILPDCAYGSVRVTEVNQHRPKASTQNAKAKRGSQPRRDGLQGRRS